METYKIIEGCENYSVSDYGNVKNNKTGRQLKPGKKNWVMRMSYLELMSNLTGIKRCID